MKTQYGIIKLSAVAGRADAAHRSEMVTQLLFGEAIKILKVKNEWVFVENAADGYQCWVLRFSFEAIDEDGYNEYISHKSYLTFDPVSKLKLKGQETLYVPCSSILPNFDPETNQGHIGSKQYTFDGNIVPARQKPSAEKVLVKANKMINTPYLWGGKTNMGIDCSGFTQALFKVSGLQLPRDAWQQAEVGEKIKLKDAHPGDLAFFENTDGKITHVGILMGNGKIIHASGRVKVCKIDEKGIFDGELNDYSHKLAVVKRVINS